MEKLAVVKGKKEKKTESKKSEKFHYRIIEKAFKSGTLTLSVLKTNENGKHTEKLKTTFSVPAFLKSFSVLMKEKDEKKRRKDALALVSKQVQDLKTEYPRSHCLIPLLQTIEEKYKKDFSSLVQKSFQVRVK